MLRQVQGSDLGFERSPAYGDDDNYARKSNRKDREQVDTDDSSSKSKTEAANEKRTKTVPSCHGMADHKHPNPN